MNPSSPLPNEPNLSLDPYQRNLERRVERLEVEVSVLKDTGALEERVTQRVSERLQKSMRSDKFTATPLPSAAYATPARPGRGRYAWLLIDMLTDARLLFIMLFDRRFPLAWTTHLVVWFFVPAILTSGWWFPAAYIPIFGRYLDKVLDLLFAFCVYKALSREMRRYKETML